MDYFNLLVDVHVVGQQFFKIALYFRWNFSIVAKVKNNQTICIYFKAKVLVARWQSLYIPFQYQKHDVANRIKNVVICFVMFYLFDHTGEGSSLSQMQS